MASNGAIHAIMTGTIMSLGVEPDGPSRKIMSSGDGTKLSSEAISERFAACEAQPSMRSLSAVLRITREQLRARDNLGFYPVVTGIAALLSAAFFAAIPMLPEEIRDTLIKAACGGPIITVILFYATWSSRDVRRLYVQQERDIRSMAASSLENILSHDFPLKPLLREQVDTLRIIAKHHPEATRVRELLQ